jgi:hypothetical protein
MESKKCVICETNLSGQKTMYCGNTCKQKHHYYRIKEQTNTYHSQTIRSLRRKIELIDLKGGKCEVCGYNKNLAALQFHHLDPTKKVMKLDMRTLGNTNMDKIMLELDKCVLLCANCHSEEHNKEYTRDNIENILKNNKNA